MPVDTKNSEIKSRITALLPPVLKRAAKEVVFHRYLHVFWHKENANWGDALNPLLIEMLSGKKVRFSSDPAMDKFMVIGSILNSADARTVVWGTGFIKQGQKLKAKPRAVCAVRGPLTREQLLLNGVEAPEIYGDPALLLPLFYNPEVVKKYELGIVPHYADKQHPWLKRFHNDPKVRVIDVEGDAFQFVQEIKSCEMVISSSLHGLICADAYQVPSVWIEFSDQVVGDGFKFRDYFAAVQREVSSPVRIGDQTHLSEVSSNHRDYEIKFNAKALLQTCPFLKEGKLFNLGL